MDKKIRSLRADEIEVRVNMVTEKGAQLLLYKDSRCDKRILDETFGVNGWQNRYEEIKGNLFCTISIWDGKQWVDKCDCGVESFSEKEKGEASDAFKRAGFNVGIGRELYTKIFYFAKVPTINVSKDPKKPKYELVDKYMTLHVEEITINAEKEKIEQIKIADNKDNVVFEYGYPKSNTAKKDSNIEPEQITKIHTLLTKLGINEEDKKKLYSKFGITTCKELSKNNANKLIAWLNKQAQKHEDNK